MEKLIHSASQETTLTLGRKFSEFLQPGYVVVLTGELGAGKTTFTKGIAEGLGITSTITSPTFVISKEYKTSRGFDLIHIDAYRLQGGTDIQDLGVEGTINNAVVVAEWGKGLFETLGNLINVEIQIEDEQSRLFKFSSSVVNLESLSL